jgi:YD repeat-containing protein
MASLVASEELLTAVRYPDESTGLPGADDAFTVRYAYNRLGELRATTDQNGTRHEYQRDAAGRVTRDAVGAVGSGIDATVRAITVAYDAAGRMREVLSTLDAAGTRVDSGVGFTYTPLWQVASVVQNPTGRAFTQAGAADPAARLSRVSTLGFNSPNGTRYPLATYRRASADLFAVVDYPAVDIQLDRTYSQKLGAPPTASATRTAGPRRPRASTRGSTASAASCARPGSTA